VAKAAITPKAASHGTRTAPHNADSGGDFKQNLPFIVLDYDPGHVAFVKQLFNTLNEVVSRNREFLMDHS
jgi:hypothetical protein